jgi:branched-chain amino acid transport system substrate-binding protein
MTPKDVLRAILSDPTNLDHVSKLVAADASYVSLNFDDPELKRVMPWAGTSAGPRGIVQTFVDVAQKMAAPAGIEIVGVERFAATDQSFVAQAIKLLATSPDAVLIAAAGTPAALPHIELKRRNFGGTIFQTQAVANNDFLRIGGKDVDNALLPVAPLLVAEQLPDSNPIKAVALRYVNKFEAQYGPGSRSLFGAMAWDAMAMVEKAAPAALQKAKPGTAEFRKALRDALESLHDLVLTQGVYSLSASDHNGADKRSQVMVRIDNGKWHYAE